MTVNIMIYIHSHESQKNLRFIALANFFKIIYAEVVAFII